MFYGNTGEQRRVLQSTGLSLMLLDTKYLTKYQQEKLNFDTNQPENKKNSRLSGFVSLDAYLKYLVQWFTFTLCFFM